MMKNAFEWSVEYARDGKCMKRTCVIGPVVVVAMVMIVLSLLGYDKSVLAAQFFSLLKP
jgi:hypothetical protein